MGPLTQARSPLATLSCAPGFARGLTLGYHITPLWGLSGAVARWPLQGSKDVKKITHTKRLRMEASSAATYFTSTLAHTPT